MVLLLISVDNYMVWEGGLKDLNDDKLLEIKVVVIFFLGLI